MSNRAIKRILSDLQLLEETPLISDGINHSFNEANMYNMKVMMIGPSETPYENGFFFFDITFPTDYPMSPPKVIYCTQDNNIRFNPNLYVNGKVCLSMINTWSGPGWTPCNTISSVLLSLQALVFVKMPLKNEPGYENHASKDVLQKYNDIIYHETYRTAVCKMIRTPPPGFDVFHEHMYEHFCKRFEWYVKRIIELNDTYGTQVIKDIAYRMQITCNYAQILADMHEIHDDIMNKNKSSGAAAKMVGPMAAVLSNLKITEGVTGPQAAPHTVHNTMSTAMGATGPQAAPHIVQNTMSTTLKNESALETAFDMEGGAKAITKAMVKPKAIRKAPKASATEFEIDYKQVSETDGKEYIIKVKSNGIKYWAKA